MIIQAVSKLEVATKPELEYSTKLAFERALGSKVEACSHYGDRVVACEYHPFTSCLHDSYAEHRPIIFSPDMFWLLIAQGFANHVNMNAEVMRHHFVDFQGKKKVIVRRDGFLKGSPENDWAGAYNEFAGKLVEFIGQDNHDRIVCSFSTTGLVERAANDLVLMDAMQSYFEFGCCTLCGIPCVTLEGTVEDWERLRDKTERLGEAYDVKWWTNGMLPVLERIVRNVAGADDPDLWQGIYKENGGSGGPFIHGWIIKFFPYLASRKASQGLRRNPYLEKDDERSFFGGMTSNEWPSGLSKVPLSWLYYDQIYEMEMLAGFAAYSQDKDTRAVRPRISWAVRDVGAVPVSRKQWWVEAAKEGAIPDWARRVLKESGDFVS